jgi:hypothetical protein
MSLEVKQQPCILLHNMPYSYYELNQWIELMPKLKLVQDIWYRSSRLIPYHHN